MSRIESIDQELIDDPFLNISSAAGIITNHSQTPGIDNLLLSVAEEANKRIGTGIKLTEKRRLEKGETLMLDRGEVKYNGIHRSDTKEWFMGFILSDGTVHMLSMQNAVLNPSGR